MTVATQLVVTLSMATTTQCSIFGPDPTGRRKQSIRLGSIVWLADDRFIGNYNPAECYPICKHQGPERKAIPCPEVQVKVFPSAQEAISFVAKLHELEAPFTFTLPAGLGEKGKRIWQPTVTPSQPFIEEEAATPAPRKRRKPMPKAERQAPATIEEMLAKAQELIKEEL